MTSYAAEEFELGSPSTSRRLYASSLGNPRAKYEDGSTIDWLHEEAAERERIQALRSHLGLRGLLLPLMDAARMWFVVAVSGIGVGLVGACLDVLVHWLGDLREGRCSYGILYNQVTCCSGIDPGEVCGEWETWSEYFDIRSTLGQVILQTSVYVILAVAFAGASAVLVQSYAPYAFHTGIPEIKAILSGYVFDEFLSSWTLLIKALGLALAVASGLSLGKEGPLVHVACCMAYLLSRFFVQFRTNEAQKRKLLAAAAAAGVSVAFGSPLGGVLFGLEELDTFSNETDVMWRAFVASALAAVSLQYVDPFGTAKLVLFQVTSVGDTWRAFELVPWLFLGVVGGVLGSILIKLNVSVAVYRRESVVNDWPIVEVLAASAITAALSYMVVFARVPTSDLVANLFQECEPLRDYHGLCNSAAMWENVFLLLLTACIKIALTAWTFGMSIPAGIFLPSIAIGSLVGRAVGILMQGMHHKFPTSFIFASCPPDLSVRCVSPGFYAVIGAASMLGGVTRMTISLVVILFELTGALSHVLPIMIAVMVAKWVGEAVTKDGIYTVWIAMRRYPWLPPVDYKDNGETGAHIMKPFNRLVVIADEQRTLGDLEELVSTYGFHGFPIVEKQRLMGYVTRDRLKAALEIFASEPEPHRGRVCVFAVKAPAEFDDSVNLSSLMEEAVIQLRKEVPQELVVGIFQRLNVRQILFTQSGKLTGMVCKTDVVQLLTSHFPHAAALAQRPRDR